MLANISAENLQVKRKYKISQNNESLGSPPETDCQEALPPPVTGTS